MIGSFAIAFIALALACGFLVYGILLSREWLCRRCTKRALSSVRSVSGLIDEPVQPALTSRGARHARKLFVVGCVCAVSFIGQSIIVLYSTAGSTASFIDWFAVLNGLYLMCDVVALSSILILFIVDDSHSNVVYKHDPDAAGEDKSSGGGGVPGSSAAGVAIASPRSMYYPFLPSSPPSLSKSCANVT